MWVLWCKNALYYVCGRAALLDPLAGLKGPTSKGRERDGSHSPKQKMYHYTTGCTLHSTIMC